MSAAETFDLQRFCDLLLERAALRASDERNWRNAHEFDDLCRPDCQRH